MAGVSMNPIGNSGFNPFAAGARVYGSGRLNPTMGPVDRTGYAERDMKRKAKLNALRAKTKAGTAGNYAGPDFMRFI